MRAEEAAQAEKACADLEKAAAVARAKADASYTTGTCNPCPPVQACTPVPVCAPTYMPYCPPPITYSTYVPSYTRYC